MKSNPMKAAALAWMLSATFCPKPVPAAPPADEQRLIEELDSTATLQQKDAACASLKRTATARAVPALAALLTDRDLSHSARYALEPMQAPEAGQALTEALERTSGLMKVGVIESLGRRREIGAAGKLIALIDDPDTTVAMAAASAAADLAPAESAETLLRALSRTEDTQSPAMRAALQDALLACADRLRLAGDRATAVSLFRKLADPSFPDHVRVAAKRGWILSAPPLGAFSSSHPALEHLVEALNGNDVPARMAALQLAREIEAPDSARALSQIAGTLPDPTSRAALIEALRQRGDAQAAPALIVATGDSDPAVRIAALGALGDLGGPSAVGTLAEAAASDDKAESKAARQALLDLHRDGVADALLDRLADGRPAAQRAVVRALVGRGEKDAVGGLLALARTADDSTAKAALDAAAQLAQADDVPGLVALLAECGRDPALVEAGKALAKVCVRLLGEGARIDAGPMISAFAEGGPKTRIALLPAAAVLRDARLRECLRDALKSPEPPMREAAIRALGDARDAELLPDLLALAENAADPAVRVPAVRSYLRLATAEPGDPGEPSLIPDRRVEALRNLIPVAREPAEKWGILGALAETSSPRALELALPMLEDVGTRAEAASAITKIAAAISAEHPEISRAALQKVLAVAAEPALRESATAALDRISTDPETMSASDLLPDSE